MDLLVSVIIPCYNAEATIGQTIQSVIDQTYSNWEMIIVDDCSSDRSARIIAEYAAQDSRIKYLTTAEPSGSPALPRNIGIDCAMGTYIAFLDADDIWLPYKLQMELEFAIDNQYPLIYSYYEKISWDGKRNGRIIRTRDLTTYSSLLKSNSIPCLTSLIRKDIVGKIRFRQIPQEDFCFWLDILHTGVKGYNLKKVTALYREANGSRSSNKLNMFKGYWNVIYKYQKVNFIFCCYYMITYSIMGLLKYLK